MSKKTPIIIFSVNSKTKEVSFFLYKNIKEKKIYYFPTRLREQDYSIMQENLQNCPGLMAKMEKCRQHYPNHRN